MSTKMIRLWSLINGVFLFSLLFPLCCLVFAWYTWGVVSIGQILFFLQMDNFSEVSILLVFQIICYCLLLPLVLTVQLTRCFCKADISKILVCSILVLVFVGKFTSYGHIIASPFNFEKVDFVSKHYVPIGDNVSNEVQRNLIVIFAESLENKYTSVMQGNTILKLDDADAVKFANLTEGYAQRWTQGALFSAFTGTPIHYLSNYYRYKIADVFNDIAASNVMGGIYEYELPNINFLGTISRHAGYQNLFVQGGSNRFSGTLKMLHSNGYDKENVYGAEAFSNQSYMQKMWWGVEDKMVFDLFKEKIKALDTNKPFFATMFTLDLHGGTNPFYNNDKEVIAATITNLNDFIRWFKEQDFYENTTLVIIGDHKRVGKDNKIGGDIYNAFFNLPMQLAENVNRLRTFNQIDMFPTLLEIMGFELPYRRAGMGVSLFSKEKTLAEQYSYEEQEELFDRIDLFYIGLWSKEKMFASDFQADRGISSDK